MTALTYGVLPSRQVFEWSWDAHMVDNSRSRYDIHNHKDDGTSMCDGSYTEYEIWDLLNELVQEYDNGNEKAGENASAILYTLGIEWI